MSVVSEMQESDLVTATSSDLDGPKLRSLSCAPLKEIE